MILEYSRNNIVLGLKVQRSRSQGHKVQKYIEGDRVAGVSLHSIEWPAYRVIVITTISIITSLFILISFTFCSSPRALSYSVLLLDLFQRGRPNPATVKWASCRGQSVVSVSRPGRRFARPIRSPSLFQTGCD